jgi:hypothetical protein
VKIDVGGCCGVAAAVETFNFGELDVISNLVSTLEWHARFVKSVSKVVK